MASCMEVVPDSTLEVLQRAALSEEQAEAIFAQGRDAVIFALLELSKQLAEQVIPCQRWTRWGLELSRALT